MVSICRSMFPLNWSDERRRGPLVIQFAKKTGDYSVLSHADICVLALTYKLDTKEKEIAAHAEKVSTEISISNSLLIHLVGIDRRSLLVKGGYRGIARVTP